MRRISDRAACLLLGAGLSCAHPKGPEIELAPCPPLEQLPPQNLSACEHVGSNVGYADQITAAMVDAVPRWRGRVSIRMNLVYEAGPRVQSACYTELSGTYSRPQLERIARQAVDVPPPPELSCYEGHRFEIHFESSR